MTNHRILTISWALLASAACGVALALFLMGNPSMNALNLWMSDVQTCIEKYGTVTCDIHHIVGARGFAVFATGALAGIFCALPTVLRLSVQPRVGASSSVLISFCMGAILYAGVKGLGLIDGFLFVDLSAMCFLGTCAGFCALGGYRATMRALANHA